MGTFQEQLIKAKKLTPQKVRSDLFEFIRTFEKLLADENVSQLFNESSDVFGKPIGFYSPGTEAITKGRKQAGQPFNLKESGELLESLYANVQSNSIFFDFSDPKKEEVFRNLLSTDVLGLTDENLNKVIEEKLLPFVINIYRKGLDL